MFNGRLFPCSLPLRSEKAFLPSVGVFSFSFNFCSLRSSKREFSKNFYSGPKSNRFKFPSSQVPRKKNNQFRPRKNVESALPFLKKEEKEVLDYTVLDFKTGESIVQQQFDRLVFSALLRYGPALPSEVLDSVSAGDTEPSQPIQLVLACDTIDGKQDVIEYGDSKLPSPAFYDEVKLKPHELLPIIRKEKPNFSLRYHSGGVPFSLLIRNCSYLRAFGGFITYMRFVRFHSKLHPRGLRGAPRGKAAQCTSVGDPAGAKICATAFGAKLVRGNSPENFKEDFNPHSGGTLNEPDVSFLVLSIGKYKFREPPSQDGIRCGPQPWLFPRS